MNIDDNGDLTTLSFFFKQCPPYELMDSIVEYVLPWERYIKKRDDDFFYKNKKIFGTLPDDSVDYFSDLWKSDKLDDDDKGIVWDYFDVFIECAKTYKKSV